MQLVTCHVIKNNTQRRPATSPVTHITYSNVFGYGITRIGNFNLMEKDFCPHIKSLTPSIQSTPLLDEGPFQAIEYTVWLFHTRDTGTNPMVLCRIALTISILYRYYSHLQKLTPTCKRLMSPWGAKPCIPSHRSGPVQTNHKKFISCDVTQREQSWWHHSCDAHQPIYQAIWLARL